MCRCTPSTRPTEKMCGRERCPRGVYGDPMTYRGRSGKQFVVITAGQGAEAEVVAFSIPEKRLHDAAAQFFKRPSPPPFWPSWARGGRWAQALPADVEPEMHELAAVVLPKSLGRKGTDKIADGFMQWIGNYKAGGAGQLRLWPSAHAGDRPESFGALRGAVARARSAGADAIRTPRGGGAGAGRDAHRADSEASQWPSTSPRTCSHTFTVRLTAKTFSTARPSSATTAAAGQFGPAARAVRSRRSTMPVHESDVCIIGAGITSAMLAEKLVGAAAGPVDHRGRSGALHVRFRKSLQISRADDQVSARIPGRAISSKARPPKGEFRAPWRSADRRCTGAGRAIAFRKKICG